MNRTAICEVGMLTQCYDNRALHPVTDNNYQVFVRVVDAVQAAAPGDSVSVGPAAAHMRVRTPDGVWTTLAELVAARWPLVVLRCDATASWSLGADR